MIALFKILITIIKHLLSASVRVESFDHKIGCMFFPGCTTVGAFV